MKRTRHAAASRPTNNDSSESDSDRRVTRSRSRVIQAHPDGRAVSRDSAISSGNILNAPGTSGQRKLDKKIKPSTKNAGASTSAGSTSKRVSEPKKRKGDEESPMKDRKRGKARALSESSDDLANVDKPKCVVEGAPEDDDASCSICLDAVDNRAFTNACSHVFCFACLRRWSDHRAVCPLCLKPFTRINHNLRAPGDFDTFDVVRPIDLSDVTGFDRLSAFMERLADQRVAEQRRRALEYQRALNQAVRYSSPFRRHIYANGAYVRELRDPVDGSAVPYRNVTPAELAADVDLERWLSPWLQRELGVFLDASRINDVINVVLRLVQQVEISSNEFFVALRSHLQTNDRTAHFAHELASFVRVPRNVFIGFDDYEDYDDYTVYDLAQNISSDDDEDITTSLPVTRAASHSAPAEASSSTLHHAHAQTLNVSDSRISSIVAHTDDLPSSSQIQFHFSRRSSRADDVGALRVDTQPFERPMRPAQGLSDISLDMEAWINRICYPLISETPHDNVAGPAEDLSVISDDGSDIVVTRVVEPRGSRTPIYLSSSEGEEQLLSDDSTEEDERINVESRQRRRHRCEGGDGDEGHLIEGHPRRDEGQGDFSGECSRSRKVRRRRRSWRHNIRTHEVDSSEEVRCQRSGFNVVSCDGESYLRDEGHRVANLHTDVVTANKALSAIQALKGSTDIPGVSSADNLSSEAVSAFGLSAGQRHVDGRSAILDLPLSLQGIPSISATDGIASDALPDRCRCGRIVTGLSTAELTDVQSNKPINEQNTAGKINWRLLKECRHCELGQTGGAVSWLSRKKRKEIGVQSIDSDNSDVEVVDLDRSTRHRHKRRKKNRSATILIDQSVRVISDSEDESDIIRSKRPKAAKSNEAANDADLKRVNDDLNVGLICSLDASTLTGMQKIGMEKNGKLNESGKGSACDEPNVDKCSTTEALAIDRVNLPLKDKTFKKHHTGHKKSSQLEQRCLDSHSNQGIDAEKPMNPSCESNLRSVEAQINATKVPMIENLMCGGSSALDGMCNGALCNEVLSVRELSSDAIDGGSTMNVMDEMSLLTDSEVRAAKYAAENYVRDSEVGSKKYLATESFKCSSSCVEQSSSFLTKGVKQCRVSVAAAQGKFDCVDNMIKESTSTDTLTSAISNVVCDLTSASAGDASLEEAVDSKNNASVILRRLDSNAVLGLVGNLQHFSHLNATSGSEIENCCMLIEKGEDQLVEENSNYSEDDKKGIKVKQENECWISDSSNNSLDRQCRCIEGSDVTATNNISLSLEYCRESSSLDDSTLMNFRVIGCSCRNSGGSKNAAFKSVIANDTAIAALSEATTLNSSENRCSHISDNSWSPLPQTSRIEVLAIESDDSVMDGDSFCPHRSTKSQRKVFDSTYSDDVITSSMSEREFDILDVLSTVDETSISHGQNSCIHSFSTNRADDDSSSFTFDLRSNDVAFGKSGINLQFDCCKELINERDKFVESEASRPERSARTATEGPSGEASQALKPASSIEPSDGDRRNSCAQLCITEEKYST